MSEQAILKIGRLTGGYSVNKPVLHNVDFEVGPGEMVGLIGLNGAGKSTTMKHILGLMSPREGEVRIGGSLLKDDPGSYRASLAFVPESPVLYEELTVREHLEFTARAYGVDHAVFEERAARLLKLFYMKDKEHSLSSHLSKGMKQKVMIMCAFIARPPLYVIDEPFLGLDPLGIRDLLEYMVEVNREGASILLSSHILSTIENYCNRFVILHKGRIIVQGTLEDIRSASNMPGASLEDMFDRLVRAEGAGGIQ